MQSKPNPERFLNFIELPDGSGFQLPGCSFIFKYDDYNGWYDEQGFYYDSNGQPAQPSRNQGYNDDGYGDEYDDYDQELENELMQEFDLGDEDYHDQPYHNEHHWNQIQKFDDLSSIIEQYGKGQQIEIYITNLNFKLRIQQIEQFFLENYNKAKPNFKITFGEKRGSAYLQTNDKEFAKHCAFKVYEILMERKVYMEIEPLETFDNCAPIQDKQKQLQSEPKTQEEEKKVGQVQEKKIEQQQSQQQKVSNEEKKIEETQQKEKVEEKKIENAQLNQAKADDDDDDPWGKIGVKKHKVKVVVKTAKPTKQTKQAETGKAQEIKQPEQGKFRK